MTAAALAEEELRKLLAHLELGPFEPLDGRTNQVHRSGNWVIRVGTGPPTSAAAGHLLERAQVAVAVREHHQRGALVVSVLEYVEPQRASGWEDVAALVARLGTVPSGGLGLVHVADRPDLTARRVQRLERSLRAVLEPALKVVDRAKEWMRDQPTVIVHQDARPANVVVGALGPRLVDWDDVALGPPELDQVLLARASPDLVPGADFKALELLGAAKDIQHAAWLAQNHPGDAELAATLLVVHRAVQEHS